MKKRQLIGLFLITGSPYIVGNATLPLFPIKLKSLGADESLIGVYLAIVFAGLFLGTLASGWLSDYFKTRRPIIFIGMGMMIVSLLMMTQANTPASLSALLTVAWFGGGLSGGIVSTLAGLYAEPAKRGQIFGTLGMSRGAAAILGGTIGTIVVKHANFDTLMTALAITLLAITLAGTIIEDRIPVRPKRNRPVDQWAPMMTGTFLALLAAGVLVSAVHFGAGLGRPLKMNLLDLDSAAIMTTSIVAGITGLLTPYLIGWLSDRIERKVLLIACYGSIVAAVVTLNLASSLWHFWVSMILFAAGGAGQNVGAALVTDMVPKEALNVGMARYMSTPWLGAAIGFGFGGFMIKLLSLDMTFTLLTVVPIVAIGLIMQINPKTPIRVTQTQTQTMVAVVGD